MKKFNEDKAVGYLSEIFALECGFGEKKARMIRNAAFLHDIGKLKLPKSLMENPGELTEQEMEVIKTHTKLGAAIVSSIQGEIGEYATMICLHHHEWYSGGGYWGIPTKYLPDYVPLVSLSDVYVSLITERPYKDAWSSDEALDYIKKQAGTQFETDLAEYFISMIRHDSRVSAIFAGM